MGRVEPFAAGGSTPTPPWAPLPRGDGSLNRRVSVPDAFIPNSGWFSLITRQPRRSRLDSHGFSGSLTSERYSSIIALKQAFSVRVWHGSHQQVGHDSLSTLETKFLAIL